LILLVVAAPGLGGRGDLDAKVAAFRQRPLDAGPQTLVWVDALVVKVREDGRLVNVHALIATG
jgi:transposase-like protein